MKQKKVVSKNLKKKPKLRLKNWRKNLNSSLMTKKMFQNRHQKKLSKAQERMEMNRIGARQTQAASARGRGRFGRR